MKKVKNNIIVSLANAGAMELTATTLPVEDAYKIVKFRRAIKKAFDEIAEREKEGIKDFNLEVLKDGKVNGKGEDIKKFIEFQKALYDDESELDCKTISYESWHMLQTENKGLQNAFIEDPLEGIFWETPNEE